jgi:hypothetical protein
MKRNLSIQLKAAFLLIVFGLNTVVGFACAVGLDMSFNTSHHHDDEATEVSLHVHADGKRHHHEEAERKQTGNDKKNDCCNDKVVKLSQVDKAIPQTAKLLSPVFFTAFIAVYHNINISSTSQVSIANKYYVLGHHPPIPDIRIAIQSFQI